MRGGCATGRLDLHVDGLKLDWYVEMGSDNGIPRHVLLSNHDLQKFVERVRRVRRIGLKSVHHFVWFGAGDDFPTGILEVDPESLDLGPAPLVGLGEINVSTQPPSTEAGVAFRASGVIVGRRRQV